MLLRGLDIRDSLKLLQSVVYLWREFAIRADVKPIIKEYIISFYYKDNTLLTFKTEDLMDLQKVIRDLEIARTE